MRRLLWKGTFVDELDDGELNVAREGIHRYARGLLEGPVYPGKMSFTDEALEQVCAVEAECMRRGLPYRNVFEVKETA